MQQINKDITTESNFKVDLDNQNNITQNCQPTKQKHLQMINQTDNKNQLENQQQQKINQGQAMNMLENKQFQDIFDQMFINFEQQAWNQITNFQSQLIETNKSQFIEISRKDMIMRDFMFIQRYPVQNERKFIKEFLALACKHQVGSTGMQKLQIFGIQFKTFNALLQLALKKRQGNYYKAHLPLDKTIQKQCVELAQEIYVIKGKKLTEYEIYSILDHQSFLRCGQMLLYSQWMKNTMGSLTKIDKNKSYGINTPMKLNDYNGQFLNVAINIKADFPIFPDYVFLANLLKSKIDINLLVISLVYDYLHFITVSIKKHIKYNHWYQEQIKSFLFASLESENEIAIKLIEQYINQISQPDKFITECQQIITPQISLSIFNTPIIIDIEQIYQEIDNSKALDNKKQLQSSRMD